ncbi:response regulator transcription factor [Roseobacteraceae bacterium S113]
MSPSKSPRDLTCALIVDDHPLFCDALALTLSLVCGALDVRRSGTLGQALENLDAHGSPDVVLLDLNLPDVTGLDGLTRLSQRLGDVPIIVVSSMADNAMIDQALRAGARGFVPKHADRGMFEAALTAVCQGARYTPQSFVAPAVQGRSAAAAEKLTSLTAQQARILQLICEGKLNKQIAFDLSIAETTVKAHVTAIMRKLGVQSRTQAVLVARDARFETVLPDIDTLA